MNEKITTRIYQSTDTQALANIYYYTIHNVNTRDYSQKQVDTWAPHSSIENIEGWQKKWLNLPPIVALLENKIVGFAEFEPNGHIDCFYVHHEFQNQGVGSVLMAQIEATAYQNNIDRIYAEVSITAKPFFEHKGFKIIKTQDFILRGCEMTNFIMEKNFTKKEHLS